MPVAPVIREQRAEEWPAVRALIDRAFAPQQAAGLLAAWVCEHRPVLSLVAEVDGELAGHVMFFRLPLRSDDNSGGDNSGGDNSGGDNSGGDNSGGDNSGGDDGAADVLCLAPLSVDPSRQRNGIARALVRHALSQLTDRPEPLVVLEGDPAIYTKFGFRPACEFGIERPSELIPEAAFQAIALPAYRTGLRGRVEYPRYFFEIDAVGPS